MLFVTGPKPAPGPPLGPTLRALDYYFQKLQEWTLTGGRAGLPDVCDRAMYRLLGLMAMFPQQNVSDPVPQIRRYHAVLDLTLEDFIWKQDMRDCDRFECVVYVFVRFIFYLADSFHSKSSPSRCRVSISVKSVGLG
ncbi:hypothetical protein F7725_012287, partial [Dissostichus mawsoni]